MAKFYGQIGFVTSTETAPGVFRPYKNERPYKGDLISTRWRNDSGQKVNNDISLSCQISILADEYAFDNYGFIKYVVMGGNKWLVNSVDPSSYPRLMLDIGGLYNG